MKPAIFFMKHTTDYDSRNKRFDNYFLHVSLQLFLRCPINKMHYFRSYTSFFGAEIPAHQAPKDHLEGPPATSTIKDEATGDNQALFNKVQRGIHGVF